MVDIGQVAFNIFGVGKRPASPLQPLFNSLAGAKAVTPSDVISTISLAAEIGSKAAPLKTVSDNLTKITTLTQIASDGITHIKQDLNKLKSLAEQAKNTSLSEIDRVQLNQQFQQTVSKINATVQNTSFGGQKLLNGELKGDKGLSLSQVLNVTPRAKTNAATQQNISLSIDDLSASKVLGVTPLNLNSAENAAAALNAINTGLAKVSTAGEYVKSFQKTIDTLAAPVEIARANQQALQSFLDDNDFGNGSGQFSLASVLQRNQQAANTHHGLSPLLSLIG